MISRALHSKITPPTQHYQTAYTITEDPAPTHTHTHTHTHTITQQTNLWLSVQRHSMYWSSLSALE